MSNLCIGFVMIMDIVIQYLLCVIIFSRLSAESMMNGLMVYIIFSSLLHFVVARIVVHRTYFLPIKKLLSEIIDRKTEDELRNKDRIDRGSFSPYINQLKNLYIEILKMRCTHCSSLKETRAALEVNKNYYKAMIEVLPDILFIYNSDGYFVDVHNYSETALLFNKKDIIGRSLEEILPDKITILSKACIREALETGLVKSFRYSLPSSERIKYFETRMVKINSDTVMAIVRDITESEREKKYIEFLSYQDPLTGLYNRRYYQEKMKGFGKHGAKSLGMILIDVNGLKLVNDTFGHETGDKWIVKVASVLKNIVDQEKSCWAMRIGGDEFVILTTNTNRKSIENLSRDIVNLVGNESINGINLSISTGYELYEKGQLDIDELFKSAEDHLLRKKVTDSQSMRHDTVNAIVSTLNEKSERERMHSINVSSIARQLAVSLGLSKEMINNTETASLLHDIGKIAVKDEILNKPGPLSRDEYKEMQKHVVSSYQILKTIDAYTHLADLVYSHHERWDGMGYPRGLKGKEIPLIGRIICVADAYEAMRTDRSYRKGVSHSEAIDELIRCSGTQFDPTMVKAFIKTFQIKEYSLEKSIC